MTVKLLLDAKAALGEGALWDEREGVLYWVDILGGKLFRYDPKTRENIRYDVGQQVGTVVLRDSGGFMLAVREGFASFHPDTGLQIIARPEEGRPKNRFNDGKADPAGRFWAGTIADDEERGAASLYCLERDMKVRKMLGNLTISNGIVWSRDHRTMYHVDSTVRTISAYDYYQATGEISNGRIAIQVPESMGYPDGMSIDSEGMLWVAHWSYSSVVRWNPHTAEVLEEIKFPTSQISSCAFGGEHLNILYVTSASKGMSEEQRVNEPLAGGLFSVDVKVRGTLSYRFKG
jgi:sugar lactone lactonase YvrE